MSGDELAGADLRVVTADGRVLGVRLWGDSAGEPILWLHGTPGSRMLRDPTDAYARHGLAVCTYDRPGYGMSSRRPRRLQADTVDDVLAVADFLGWERFAVAGASGGGGPALAAAALAPHRVTRCAVVVGTAPPTIPEVQAAMPDDDLASFHSASRADVDALAREFDDLLAWFEAGMPDVDLDNDARRRMLEEVVREASVQGAAGYIDDNIADAQDWGFSVEAIRVPTKIMAAEEDTDYLHFCSRWLADHIPQAELIWRAGGHVNPRGDEEERLFHWLGHGTFPDSV